MGETPPPRGRKGVDEDRRRSEAKLISQAIQSVFSSSRPTSPLPRDFATDGAKDAPAPVTSPVYVRQRYVIQALTKTMQGEMPRAAIQNLAKQVEAITQTIHGASSPHRGASPDQKVVCLDQVSVLVMDAWFEQQSRHIEYLKSSFRAFDENRDGVLNADEFQEVVAVVMPAGDRRAHNPRTIMRLFKAASEFDPVSGEQVVTPQGFAETLHEYITHDTCSRFNKWNQIGIYSRIAGHVADEESRSPQEGREGDDSDEDGGSDDGDDSDEINESQVGTSRADSNSVLDEDERDVSTVARGSGSGHFKQPPNRMELHSSMDTAKEQD